MAMACSAATADAPPPQAPAPPPGPVHAGPDWLYDIPWGCALGDSGPTLRPTDALLEARRRARARLVTVAAPIEARSVSAVTTSNQGSEAKGVTHERAEGWVRDTVVVALWYDEAGVGPEHAAGCAYAAACLGRDRLPPAAVAWVDDREGHRAGPAWIYGSPRGEHRLCAMGISGPTLVASQAPENALAAAQEQLADAISLRAASSMSVDEDDQVHYGAVTRACEDCLASAKAARVVARWTDERGEGPLSAPGTAYAFLCVDGPLAPTLTPEPAR
jgi:hypothetical protein